MGQFTEDFGGRYLRGENCDFSPQGFGRSCQLGCQQPTTGDGNANLWLQCSPQGTGIGQAAQGVDGFVQIQGFGYRTGCDHHVIGFEVLACGFNSARAKAHGCILRPCYAMFVKPFGWSKRKIDVVVNKILGG